MSDLRERLEADFPPPVILEQASRSSASMSGLSEGSRNTAGRPG